jgi:hypothetical protein
VSGQDPIRFLKTEDSLERAVMQLVAKRAWEYKLELNKHLAVEIVNNIGKAFFKK